MNLRVAVFVLVAAATWHAPKDVRAQGTNTARIPVKVVDGKLVAACDLSTEHRRIPANLLLEYEKPAGLELHNRATQPLRAERRDGSTIPITIHFPGIDIVVERREHGDEDFLNEFTKYNAAALGENAAVGTIGAEIFGQYHVTLDLAAGFVELSDPRGRSAPQEGDDVVPMTMHGGLVWLQVIDPDERPRALALGTGRYDTVVDEVLCDAFGKPAGNIGSLRVGQHDISAFVAPRPEEVILAHPDGAVGMVGLNLLEHFRISIDRENRVARLVNTVPADFPQVDFEYFQALLEEEADPLEAFIDKHPEARLAREAAERLLEYRLDEEDDDACVRAIQKLVATRTEDLRATAALDAMAELSNAGRPKLVIAAGEHGVPFGRDDRYPDAVHKIHAKLGQVRFDLGEERQAWRNLLSAAFGMPEDGPVNYNLGRYYEAQGRPKRAFSRYLQAAISPDSGPQAMAGLERVQATLGDGQAFDVDLIDRMIEGKVQRFGAASKFKPSDEDVTNRIVLGEFFTNAQFEQAIGGALANEGLLSHFERHHLAMIAYHLPDPENEPLVNELSAAMATRLEVPGPYVHVFNGRTAAPGGGRASDREGVYNRCRRAVLDELLESSANEISITGRVQDGIVSGDVTVSGPAGIEAHVQVLLVERGVLFPGKSKVVVHRMVARGSLLQTIDGVAYAPTDGAMRIPFSKSLVDMSAANEKYLDDRQAAGEGAVVKMSLAIDPRQVSVIAILRDWSSNTVLQAAQLDPTTEGGS